MSGKKIYYSFHYWGPLLFQSKLKDSTIKKILNLCSKNKKKDHRERLAGDIKNEYLIDEKKIQDILEPYLYAFKNAYKHWYNSNCDTITATTAWVNYMKPGDSNPFHIHTECDLSSVIYLKLPKGLDKEIKEYRGTTAGPGTIMFAYGEESKFHITWKSFKPKIGDMFIFPYSLRHGVNTYRSPGERVSVAVNYSIKARK